MTIETKTVKDGPFSKMVRTARTAEDMWALLGEGAELWNAEPEESLSYYEKVAGEILRAEGWPGEWCEELVTWGSTPSRPRSARPVSPRARDAKEVIACVLLVRDCLGKDDMRGAIVHAIALGWQVARAGIRLHEPDMELGERRREQQREFARAGNAERRELAEKKREQWRAEAARVRVANPSIASKRALAGAVKRNLRAVEKLDTIARSL